jgi:hypothetical protein
VRKFCGAVGEKAIAGVHEVCKGAVSPRHWREARFFFSKPISVPVSCAIGPFTGEFYTQTVNKGHEQAFPVISSAPPRRGRWADRPDVSSSPQWDRLDWRLGSGAQIRALRRRRVLHTGRGTTEAEDRYHLFTGWQGFVRMRICSQNVPHESGKLLFNIIDFL